MPDVDPDLEPADAVVLARSASGDLEALAMLYDRYAPLAYGVAVRITADRSLAEDVVQEAFLGAWRHAGRYVPERGSVRSWLLAIVHHRAIDAVRRRRTTAELPASDVALPASFTLPDVWAEVVGRLDRSWIRAGLEAINADQRQALELAYFGGLSQQEISAQVGAPLGTIKSRVRLGLVALRRALLAAEGETPAGAAPSSPERREKRTVDGGGD
ncbi:MAG: sigma-70 family RNA polymerase sigma factor [Candidatus Limnocylindrales bacterium]